MQTLGTERIQDAADPRLDPYRNIRDPAWIHRRDRFVAEGLRVVETLLQNPRIETVSVVVAEPTLERLLEAGTPASTPIYVVSRATLEQVAGVRFHQGCVACARVPEEPHLGKLLEPEGPRCLLILERVSDPDNIGGLFRNACAFGVQGVLLGPGCGHPLYRKATRTSLGATLQVPFVTLRDWPAEIERVREANFRLVALTPRAPAIDIESFVRSGPERVALLLGDEGYGLSDVALRASDLRVRIPMAHGVDSLNVATAAAITLQRVVSPMPGAVTCSK